MTSGIWVLLFQMWWLPAICCRSLRRGIPGAVSFKKGKPKSVGEMCGVCIVVSNNAKLFAWQRCPAEHRPRRFRSRTLLGASCRSSPILWLSLPCSPTSGCTLPTHRHRGNQVWPPFVVSGRLVAYASTPPTCKFRSFGTSYLYLAVTG